jgi:hypothetical protein
MCVKLCLNFEDYKSSSNFKLIVSQEKQCRRQLRLRRSSVFEDRLISAVSDERPETTITEDVAWVRFVTGAAGGCAWPGFTAVIEIDGKDGVSARGNVKLSGGGAVGDADEGITCACDWDGSVSTLKAADAVMLETSQDMYGISCIISIHHHHTRLFCHSVTKLRLLTKPNVAYWP